MFPGSPYSLPVPPTPAEQSCSGRVVGRGLPIRHTPVRLQRFLCGARQVTLPTPVDVLERHHATCVCRLCKEGVSKGKVKRKAGNQAPAKKTKVRVGL